MSESVCWTFNRIGAKGATTVGRRWPSTMSQNNEVGRHEGGEGGGTRDKKSIKAVEET